ncbi:hypothetical protein J0895_14405 [Phormidium pseudopriestleyi FRX01]|uniref:Uncharacterized protein n=1 Tax=Phormidium pseudopriestleyi FRX01 TaxID=1759528 RepID=A0ABS3FT26_9CYAN|nr:hypothetical protein [Phormidium pseudopriestleyi]MBO0350275.1 hypothetical protein [Phormidium pseudopriestleyi FRX01]
MVNLKSTPTIDTTSSPVPAPVAHDWEFVEIWLDPLQNPPYVLLLRGDNRGNCEILDPAQNYALIFASCAYEDAQNWLLEDEYEPVEGRLNL